MDLTRLAKLKEDMKFKNYKALCLFLNEPLLSGNSKIKQLKEWDMYFNFEKTIYSNEYVIIHINKERRKKADRRKKYYEDIASDLLFRLCYEQPLFITTKSLLQNYGMINHKYNTYEIDRDFVLFNELTEQEKNYYIREYEQIISSKLHHILNSVLQKMKDSGLISYERVYVVRTECEEKERICTLAEYKMIDKLSRACLKNYGVDFINELNCPQKKEFINNKNTLLNDNGFISAYKVLRICYTGNEELNSSNYKFLNKHDMNDKIKKSLNDSIVFQSKKSHDKQYYLVMSNLINFMNSL